MLTFFVGGLIGAFADATGRRTILILAEIVASLPNLALWLWWIFGPGAGVSPAPLSIYVYYAVRALSGLMNSVAVGVAYVADVTSEENRAVCIGILIAIAAIGIASAPVGTALPYGVAFAASNVLNAFTIVFCMFCIKESLPEEDRIPLDREKVNPLRTMGVLVRNKLFVLLTIVILANSATNKGTTDINPFVLQRNFGFDSTQLGYLVVALAGSVIFVQAFMIKPLIMCLGERGTIFLGIAAGMPLYIGIAVASLGNGEQWLAYVLIIVFGAMSTLVFPAISSMESRNSDKEEQGLVQGALFGAQSLAQAAGGLTFPTIYGELGQQGAAVAYGVAACVQVLAVVAVGLVPRGVG